jgi:hypothetical protein
MQNVNLYWLIPEVLTGLLAVALVWRYADWIVAWLKSKNWTAHTVFALALPAAGIITFNPQAQQLLVDLLKTHPAFAADIILLAGVIAKYSHSSSLAGTLATARNIEAATSIPTAKIDAADTTTK